MWYSGRGSFWRSFNVITELTNILVEGYFSKQASLHAQVSLIAVFASDLIKPAFYTAGNVEVLFADRQDGLVLDDTPEIPLRNNNLGIDYLPLLVFVNGPGVDPGPTPDKLISAGFNIRFNGRPLIAASAFRIHTELAAFFAVSCPSKKMVGLEPETTMTACQAACLIYL
jgi:hypothetical protein